MKYFSMFSGIGGFELGIQRAHNHIWGITEELCKDDKLLSSINQSNGRGGRTHPLCVGYSEIDKYAIQTYEKNFGKEVQNYGDATKIIAEELPDFDMLCGGFPCQAFSIAGKRRGFEDTRGTLFFDVARILKVKRPKIVFLENVKGLLNHNKGETFKVILQTLDELGYEVQWMVLNSKFFGVPQNRERVFIIGNLRGTSRPKILPFNKDVREVNIKVVGYLNDDGWDKRNECIRRIYDRNGICPTIPTGQGGGVIPKIRAVLTPNRLNKRQNGRRFKEEGEPSFTLTGQDVQGVMVKKVISKVKVRKHIVDIPKLKVLLREHKRPIKDLAEKLNVKPTTVQHWFRNDKFFSIPDAEIWFKLKKWLNINTDEFDKAITEFEIKDNTFDQSNRIYQIEGVSPTLTTLTSCHQQIPIETEYQIRRLTPTECERLQGYPDCWTEGVSDTQRYKQLGNSVTVNVIEAIAIRLLNKEGDNEK